MKQIFTNASTRIQSHIEDFRGIRCNLNAFYAIYRDEIP